MEHERLIADLRDEELHVEPALRGRRDRVQHRLVRHEVRRADLNLLLRRVQQRVEEPQVVLALERRPARHYLRVQNAGRVGLHDRRSLAQEQLIRLAVPVRREQCVDTGDDRPLEPHHELLPLQAARPVGAAVVGALDEVLRPRESHVTIDDEELAVVAQIRPLILAPPWAHREHPVPQGADRVEPTQHPAVPAHPQ